MKKLFIFTALAGFFYSNAQYTGKVGVNTETPTEVTDINGTLRVRDLPYKDKTNSHSTTSTGTLSGGKDQTYKLVQPVMANAQGVIGTFDDLNATDPKKPLTFFSYKVFAEGGNGDWLTNFDTKIDVTKYDLNIMNIYLANTGGRVGYTLFNFGGVNTVLEPTFRIWNEGGTWRIAADYNGANARTDNSTTGETHWVIDVMIVDKAFGKNLPVREVRFSGTSGADTAPAIN